MASTRLIKELEQLKKSPPENCSAGPIDDQKDIRHWKAMIIGPSGTPYENGIFYIDVVFPSDYPFKPPDMKFITKIYHPNVSGTGRICLDILKNKWSPALTLSKTLLSLCSLLSEPNPDDPLVGEIAQQYKQNYEAFCDTARSWTQRYASSG